MAERKKVAKMTVNYRRHSGPKKCGNCAMYHSNGSCDLVIGRIVPAYVCDKWVKKDA